MNMIEAVQKRFLKFLHNRIFGYYAVEELLAGFNVLSLSKREIMSLFLYLYDLLRGRVSQSVFLSKINIDVPRRFTYLGQEQTWESYGI